jgi:hypothetical protein
MSGAVEVCGQLPVPQETSVICPRYISVAFTKPSLSMSSAYSGHAGTVGVPGVPTVHVHGRTDLVQVTVRSGVNGIACTPDAIGVRVLLEGVRHERAVILAVGEAVAIRIGAGG